MPQRTALWTCTEQVDANIPEPTCEALVARTVDIAYERNLIIQGVFIKRYKIIAHDGQQAAVIVIMTEENGQDHCQLVMQSDFNEQCRINPEFKAVFGHLSNDS
jgi:hypothetical protein